MLKITLNKLTSFPYSTPILPPSTVGTGCCFDKVWRRDVRVVSEVGQMTSNEDTELRKRHHCRRKDSPVGDEGKPWATGV